MLYFFCFNVFRIYECNINVYQNPWFFLIMSSKIYFIHFVGLMFSNFISKAECRSSISISILLPNISDYIYRFLN